MVRIVASLRSCVCDTTWCTASTDDGPASHTACITLFSRSVSGPRTRVPDRARVDMARLVPLHAVTVKRAHVLTNERAGPAGFRDDVVARFARLAVDAREIDAHEPPLPLPDGAPD